MSGNFIEIIGKTFNRWIVRVIPEGIQPLPNTTDFGSDSITLQFCIYNKKEHDEKFSKPLSIDNVEGLSSNSILFDSDGQFIWKVGNSDKLEYPITKEEYNNAHCLIIWSDPFGSAAFKDGTYRKGVFITKAFKKTAELKSRIMTHVIEVELQVIESVISFFIDLVIENSSGESEFLKGLCDGLNNNETRLKEFGKLGVISPSIGANNTKFLSIINNSAEKIYGTYYDSDTEVDLYDLDFWYDEYAKKKDGELQWGDTKISLYDFKEPIGQHYGAMLRIGNDAKIYSNEGFSNLDWGILSYQTGIGSDNAKMLANMDPSSRDEIQDDIATDEGYELAMDSASSNEKPVFFDRRKLFLNTVKTIQRTGGYYTHLEVQIHNEKEKARKEKLLSESRKHMPQIKY